MSCPQRFCPVRNRNELWFPMKCVIFLSLLLVDIIQIYPSKENIKFGFSNPTIFG